MNVKREYEWTVSSADSGVKLIKFLSSRFSSLYSSKKLKLAIESNQCLINGHTERFAATLVGAGDCIQFFPSFNKREVLTSEVILDLKRLIYEDQDLLIYNKPSGAVCHENGLLKELKTYNRNLRLIHRLDKETTGVLILVKNQQSYDSLLQQFQQFQIKKTYAAIVDGELKQRKGVIDNFLSKKAVYDGQSIYAVVKNGGLRAITYWERLKLGKTATLLTCYPKTGRTHQLRVHLKSLGFPILGDFQYHSLFKCDYKPDHHLLHAEKISFYHPTTKKFICYSAEKPLEFTRAENALF